MTYLLAQGNTQVQIASKRYKLSRKHSNKSPFHIYFYYIDECFLSVTQVNILTYCTQRKCVVAALIFLIPNMDALCATVKVIGRGKVAPVLNEAPHHEGVLGSGGIAPCIL
jgi:hypothetical protein